LGNIFDLWQDYRINGFCSVFKRILLYIPAHYLLWKTQNTGIKCGINTTETRRTKVIVSMTSYPERFGEIDLCIKSLLLQSYKPDKIIIWFGSDSQERDLTESMREYQKYGVEYRFDPQKNLKAHKKYYYAMREFPEDIVITVDDDAVYPRNTVRSLIKNYYKHPNAVSARRVHKITFKNNKINPYDKWKKEYRWAFGERFDLMAVGVGGVLYPPHCLNENAFDTNALIDNCINADDIWLKCMETLKKTKVVWTPCLFCHPPTLRFDRGLSSINSVHNDEYIESVMKLYSITFPA